MDSKKTFSLILEAVKELVSKVVKEKKYIQCKFDILISTDTSFRVIVESNDCIGEILVSQTDFAPYRYVKIEILSSVDVENINIFTWYDSENDSLDEILFQIQKGIEIVSKYKSK
ncbi:MAG: hypothetical protein IJ429_01105 [Lachnospiraceae bacterium]|nr:hypothetical protein [Lachnospiraceae bacterium]